MQSVATLAGIVLLRTFLGCALTMERESRVPWRSATTGLPTPH